MDSYKYTCPYCGQHIEYTDGYCGQQMPCPVCQHRITFPAIPPGSLTSPKRSKLRLQKPIQAAKSESAFARFIGALRQYEHWNIVGQCLVPFVILAAALVVASRFHSRPQEQPVSTPAPVDPATWERMTQLDKIEPVVQERLRLYNTAVMRNAIADKNRTDYQKLYGARLDAVTARGLDRTCDLANKEMGRARQAFEEAMSKYMELGGKIDYRLQVVR